jgi:hypothetical protein
MPLILEPFTESKFILCSSEELRNLLCVFAPLERTN